ncbi:multidrug transporter EmrA [Kosakonia radicincitans DSM 16656]|uniref:Multidrug resistance efflux pump n=1 Tax=Kosakonia radicincitans TaxID=283686 RepID=A0AAX2EPJ9_9ENTR|nr:MULTISPECIES: HlyD family secretion protein [Kosakonia]MDP9566820.1 multidrug resistance efflux pump [Kosakonia oryzae]APG18230.1 multidrug transporter EmrA [Kosakonia radicincitans]ARD60679.1 multidrug transporter EmrA [Kosakonia radicincitans DSM 16656]MDD7995853.1 HlyD family secretion protein [Kosakonia radicincitans]NCF06601.1 HlyD family secretion protein [Kosakonia sp. MH5]
MSQQDAAKERASTRNNVRIVSLFTAAAIGLVGVLVILYAWQLPPFTRHTEFTDNAYVRGQTTFISPQVNGYITEVPVQDFVWVKKGDLIMQIDDRIYHQRVDQAKATLAMKKAALANNLQQRKSAEAVIERNKAALASAKAQDLKSQADLKRVKALTADGSLSIRERDAALATAAQNTASIAQAEATLEMSRQDLQTTIVNRASLQADVENAEAALELAQIDLQNTRIVAPRDGQLGQISVRLGAYVTAGTHLTSLVPSQRWVIANLKETQLADVVVGQPVRFTVDALDGRSYHGRVESLSPATGVEFSAISPDNATGNFVKIAQRIPVRIQVEGNDDDIARLRPGMSVQVYIDTGEPQK